MGEKHIELKKTITVVLKRWWLLLLIILIFGIGANLTEKYLLEKTYQAQTSLFIGKESGTIGGIGLSFADIQTYSQLIVDYKEIAKSRMVIMQTLDNLNIKMDISDFKNKLSIDIVNNSRLFTVSFRDKDPILAKNIVNELAKQLTIAASNIVNVENIRVIDKALVPNRPITPNGKIITLIAVMIGFVLGLFIIYIIEIFDDTIANQEIAEKELELSVMGVIPKFKDKSEKDIKKSLIVLNEPQSHISESFRLLRTNITSMNIDRDNKVLMMTSALPSEGKTVTSCNLAITISQAEKKVLLIDADLRKPKVHELFNISKIRGLTDVIYEKLPLAESIHRIVNIPGLDVLATGASTLKPSELLASKAFKKVLDDARNHYDVIIIDTPPVLSVSDPTIVSKLADGILFVVGAEQTSKWAVKKARRGLGKLGVNLLGVVLTKVSIKKDNYYGKGYL